MASTEIERGRLEAWEALSTACVHYRPHYSGDGDCMHDAQHNRTRPAGSLDEHGDCQFGACPLLKEADDGE